jgi:hypothetical protein
MKPNWLIQTNMEGVDTGSLIAEVTSQGMFVLPIEHRLGKHIDFDCYSRHDCTICYGDIDFVRQVYHRSPFIPGAWCNFDNMKCSTYYAHFGGHLLNNQYVIMPLGDLQRRLDEFIYYHTPLSPSPKAVFIRPDSGAKPFTGYVVKPDEEYKIQQLIEDVGPETLVIVAPEKPITAEWRFVICDRKVVTGCQYLPTESKWIDPESFRLAYKISQNSWQPDTCYTVDMAESDGRMHLLEINSFSCAGFYDCDIAKIVEHASRAAIAEWNEYHVS